MVESDIRKIFGNNLKFFRKEKNISQMQLAENADVTFNFINDIENGKKWISPATLSKLCLALDVQPYQLFLDFSQSLHSDNKDRNKYFSELSDDLINQIGIIIKKTLLRHRD
jgi:transcriptional regulator with XRE-family HTH domain